MSWSSQKLSGWAWFMGFWGIGTYKRNDEVDVRYEVDGRPMVAHALDDHAPPEPAAVLTTSRATHGRSSRSADRIARVACERFSV